MQEENGWKTVRIVSDCSSILAVKCKKCNAVLTYSLKDWFNYCPICGDKKILGGKANDDR